MYALRVFRSLLMCGRSVRLIDVLDAKEPITLITSWYSSDILFQRAAPSTWSAFAFEKCPTKAIFMQGWLERTSRVNVNHAFLRLHLGKKK